MYVILGERGRVCSVVACIDICFGEIASGDFEGGIAIRFASPGISGKYAVLGLKRSACDDKARIPHYRSAAAAEYVAVKFAVGDGNIDVPAYYGRRLPVGSAE